MTGESDSLEWNALLCNELSDVDEMMADVFAYLVESTDVFLPLTVSAGIIQTIQSTLADVKRPIAP